MRFYIAQKPSHARRLKCLNPFAHCPASSWPTNASPFCLERIYEASQVFNFSEWQAFSDGFLGQFWSPWMNPVRSLHLQPSVTTSTPLCRSAIPAISCSFDGSPVRRVASCRNVSQLSYSTKISRIRSRVRSRLDVTGIQSFFWVRHRHPVGHWVSECPKKTKIPDSSSRGMLRLNSPPPSAARFLGYGESYGCGMAPMGGIGEIAR